MKACKHKKDTAKKNLLNTAYGRRTADGGEGVTLIELVMVITVVGILTGVSSMYIKETIGLWRFLSFRSEAVAQGRLALLRVEREVRQIQNDTSVRIAEASRFQFDDMGATTITFELSADNLLLNSDILAGGVSDLTFAYYDSSGLEIAAPDVFPSPTNIRRIDISFTIGSGGQNKTLTTRVYPRNL